MVTEGSTNLYDGLIRGLEVLKGNPTQGRLSAVLILTDGQPNRSPEIGNIPALKEWIDKNGLACTINTFGFGTRLDSALM